MLKLTQKVASHFPQHADELDRIYTLAICGDKTQAAAKFDALCLKITDVEGEAEDALFDLHFAL